MLKVEPNQVITLRSPPTKPTPSVFVGSHRVRQRFPKWCGSSTHQNWRLPHTAEFDFMSLFDLRGSEQTAKKDSTLAFRERFNELMAHRSVVISHVFLKDCDDLSSTICKTHCVIGTVNHDIGIFHQVGCVATLEPSN